MTNNMNTLNGSQWEKREDIKRGYKRRQRILRLRRLSLNCWVHKRLPVCDPLSIQDQSVIGSNYCKFLCVLSTKREGGRVRQREREQQQRQQQPSLQLQVIRSSLNSEVYFKLMKTFLSTAAFQLSRAHLTTSASHPSPRCWLPAWFAFLWNLTGSEVVAECLSSGGVVRVIMAMSQERRACLGLWVLLLLGAGMKEVVEGCSCHPAHPQQLFCSAEIGKSTAEATKAVYSGLCSVLL